MAVSVAEVPEQIVSGEAVGATGIGLMVMITVSLTLPHGPAGSFVVKINMACVSPVPGVYTALKLLLDEKDPVPPLHVPLVAEPPMLPASVAVVPAQMDWLVPASAVAAGLMVTLAEWLAAAHPPAATMVLVMV